MASGQDAPPAVLFFGMAGQFSRAPLLALLAAGIAVRAVVLPSAARLAGATDVPPIAMSAPVGVAAPRGHALPVLGNDADRNIVQIARRHEIPVLEVARPGDPLTLAALAAYAPDAICVACFPWRLPGMLLALPPLGAVNLHPSLLPENRGPDPLFWTFRRGDRTTGVTAHLMDERLDAGPIVIQRALPVPEGITEGELERHLAEVGGELLARAVWGLAQQSVQPRPQDEARATAYPWPRAADYVVTPACSARWAHGFVRGIGARGVPLRAAVEGHAFRVVESLGYTPEAAPGPAWRLRGDRLDLRCSPGVWHARVLPAETADRIE